MSEGTSVCVAVFTWKEVCSWAGPEVGMGEREPVFFLVQQACLDLHLTSASWAVGHVLPPETTLLGVAGGSWHVARLPWWEPLQV